MQGKAGLVTVFDSSIVWYLFLGGTGAGMLAVLAGADILFWLAGRPSGRDRLAWTSCLARPLFARGLPIASLLLIVGAFSLLIDLGHPERFFYVILHPTVSVLTFGSYALAATVLCAVFLSSIALFNLTRIAPTIIRIVEVIAVALGFSMMAYTGVFLANIDFIPLWNNPFLPVLFTFSSLSCGIMCMASCALFEQPDRRNVLIAAFAKADAAVIILEIVSLGAYIAYGLLVQTEAQAIDRLLAGDTARLFWIGFACIGALLPLAFEAASTRIGTTALPALAIPLVLIGGYLLRYCMVNAPYG